MSRMSSVIQCCIPGPRASLLSHLIAGGEVMVHAELGQAQGHGQAVCSPKRTGEPTQGWAPSHKTREVLDHQLSHAF